MIISREEFHHRYAYSMEVQYVKVRKFPVARLMKEARLDAPFRNHEFMFNGVDLATLPVQETTSDICDAYPWIKTERERVDKIKEQLLDGSYEPVHVGRDADYPDVIFIQDGFHRIYAARELGWRSIKCRIEVGKFKYTDKVSFMQLRKLLGMVDQMFTGKSNKWIVGQLSKEDIDEEKLRSTFLDF